MKWTTLWSLALVGSMVASCGGGSGDSSGDATSQAIPIDTGDPTGICAPLSSVFTDLLALINEARIEESTPPLRFSLQLGKSAQEYAKDLATQGYLSHNGKDGSTFISRIGATGYPSAGIGENLAGGYQSAQAAFTAWANSESHNANMLNKGFSEVGFGVYETTGDSGLGRYWVQHFGNPASQPSAEGIYIPSECGLAATSTTAQPGLTAVAGQSNLVPEPRGVDHGTLPPTLENQAVAGTLPVNILAAQVAEVSSDRHASVPEPAIALGLGTLGLALWRDHKNKVKKSRRNSAKR
ncbi:MAG: CAP domain-containing protein [Cyanobacteria bacterium J06554_3]